MDRPSLRVLGGAILAIAALFTAVLTRSAELVVVSSPFAVVVLVGLTTARVPRTDAALTVPDRLLEGEQTTVAVTIEVPWGRGRARISLELPPGLERVGGPPLGLEVALGPGTHRLEWTVLAGRWGLLGAVRARLVSSDLLGSRTRSDLVGSEPVRVLPREESLRRLVSPRALRSIAGAHLSRQRGDGIEFVDTRQFAAGDRARDVNWRVSARRPELWVDQRRPERSGEVVVFIDTFVSVGDQIDNTVRRTAEIAGALARRHIGINDRVGLVDLGGVLRWVRPGGGTAQLYRLVETLVETERVASSADKTVDVLPARALPRRCLVVVISPLVDARGVDAVRTLRARGFDVAVVEVPPSSFLPPPATTRGALARAIWELERDAVRSDLRRRGVAVATWQDGDPVDPVMDALGVFRTAVLRAAR